jgi:hypothetical protein
VESIAGSPAISNKSLSATVLTWAVSTALYCHLGRIDMDFAAIGESFAMAKAMRTANESAQEWIDWSSRQVAIARAERDAQDAGRVGQLKAVLDALRAVDPGNPLLQETGLHHPNGSPEIRWQRAYDRPYDDVAVRNAIPMCEKAVSPAEARRLAVMREPVTSKRVFLCRTWWWRGTQYRSERGAAEARKRAADEAARG